MATAYGGSHIHDGELNQICSKVSAKSQVCIFMFNTLKKFCEDM